MSERAYLKTVSGRMRLRVAAAGEDANDLDLPTEKVIFDSEALDALPVLVSGVYIVTSSEVDNFRFVSWPSLPFTPFHIWAYGYGNGSFGCIFAPDQLKRTIYVAARNDGLYVTRRHFGSWHLPIKYTVFRRSI